MTDRSAYADKRVLITGNTGFKGSWLSLWMKLAGAEVVGMSLQPDVQPNHWQYLNLDIEQHNADVRSPALVARLVARIQPDIIFHLAAQSLVRESYLDPLQTWHTNVMGTANVLDACRHLQRPCAVIIVTSDKCYQNTGSGKPFVEGDPLGGHDPYSASKAAAELLTASYRDAFFSQDSEVLVASVRAGNVIGGGDWSADRLIPDAVRAYFSDVPLYIRYPRSTRPWQHVLEAIAGYSMLGERLLAGESRYARSWNFSSDDDSHRSVTDILKALRRLWPALDWTESEDHELHEASLLALDSSLARQELGWKPRWDFDATMTHVADWYRCWYEDRTIITDRQIASYMQ